MKEKTIILAVVGMSLIGCAAVFGYYFAWPKYQACVIEEANQKTIAEAQARVAANLRDPTSAQFRNSRVDFGDAVCGQVNGKNAFGAYAGYHWFRVTTSEVTIDYPEAPIQLARVICAR